jgi:hypothetical protein
MPSSHFPLTIEFYMRGYIAVGARARDGPERYQLAKHMITKLEHRKIVARGEKPEHEDIVATIVDNEGIPFRILIERRKHSPKVSTSKYEDDQAERMTTTWSLLKFASPTVFNNPLSDIASQEIATFQSEGTTPIDGAKNASESKSPQDSTDTSLPALDVVRTLMPDYQYPSHVVVLRTFEPAPNTLSLLSLAVAIEATHDAQPYYRTFPGQSRWFALTVMGISMLQGGRVKVFEGKGDPGPHWEPLSPHILSDAHLPVVLGLPVPKPEPFVNSSQTPASNSQTQGYDSSAPFSDLLAQTPDSPKARENKLPIVKPSFQEILAIAQESQQRYDGLYKAVSTFLLSD